MLEQTARTVVESLSPKGFKSCADVARGAWVSAGVVRAGLMVGFNDLKGLLQSNNSVILLLGFPIKACRENIALKGL